MELTETETRLRMATLCPPVLASTGEILSADLARDHERLAVVTSVRSRAIACRITWRQESFSACTTDFLFCRVAEAAQSEVFLIGR